MMEDWICRQNIQRWRSQLAAARDERQREVLIVLLAEEHEKLRRFVSAEPRHRGAAGTAGANS
jgi:dsDNA-binding SOS-regulon protein